MDFIQVNIQLWGSHRYTLISPRDNSALFMNIQTTSSEDDLYYFISSSVDSLGVLRASLPAPQVLDASVPAGSVTVPTTVQMLVTRSTVPR